MLESERTAPVALQNLRIRCNIFYKTFNSATKWKAIHSTRQQNGRQYIQLYKKFKIQGNTCNNSIRFKSLSSIMQQNGMHFIQQCKKCKSLNSAMQQNTTHNIRQCNKMQGTTFCNATKWKALHLTMQQNTRHYIQSKNSLAEKNGASKWLGGV